MLLKRHRKLSDIVFTRDVFTRGENICNKCCLSHYSENCSLRKCDKANFGGLLFPQEYRYAYVVKEM